MDSCANSTQLVNRGTVLSSYRTRKISKMFGDGHLEAVELKDNESGERRTINVGGVFSFIGATPRTAWLPPEIEADLNEAARAMPNWTSESPTIGEVRILALC